MRFEIYAVRDKAVDAFVQPLFFRSKGEALRSFLDAVKSNDMFKAHPEDYDFYSLGTYDDNTGEFVSAGPVVVLTGMQAASKEKGGN